MLKSTENQSHHSIHRPSMTKKEGFVLFVTVLAAAGSFAHAHIMGLSQLAF
ncbi:hypothetical protein AB6D11_00965 [Vibrio splendidus]